MHTFSPAKMWIAGLTDLRKPLVHLHTQYNRDLPWADIDMDFMNLHQSAHGDREFAFIQTRLRRARKTVVGHWEDPAVAARLGWWTRAAAGWHEAHRLRVARFGDNMREVAVTEGDKVEAQARFGFSVNGYGVADLAARVADVAEGAVDQLVADYDASYEVVPSLRPDGERRVELRVAARIEAGLRAFLEDGGFGAFTDTFEDLGELPAATGHRRPAPDGRGLRLRSRGRLEGGRPRAHPQGHGRRPARRDVVHGGLHLPPRRSRPGGARGAHARGLPVDRRRASVLRDPSAVDRRHARIPVRLVFDAAPGSAIIVGLADLGDRFRLIASEVEVVAPDAPLPRLPVARAVWRPKPDLATAAESWLTAGGPHHTAMTTSLPLEPLADFAEIADVELIAIDDATTARSFRQELRWNQPYYFINRGT